MRHLWLIPDTQVEVDGQIINIPTMNSAVGSAIKCIKSGFGFSFLTLNLDHLVNRRLNTRFREAYARATFVSADGQPVVNLARRVGAKIERTTGADLVNPLCAASAEMGISVYLFGSDIKTLKKATQKLKANHKQLNIAGLEAPSFGFDADGEDATECAERIAISGATICFVALPSVKATYFIDRFSEIYPHIGFVGVGAALDFVANTQFRAPKWFQKMGFEWLWRLSTNPRGLFARYFSCGVLYIQLRLKLVKLKS
jgi:N-acetylglucosaminyldiphosphoundecaprenol N-acetyl-beta-D-mannosaminyltransferase